MKKETQLANQITEGIIWKQLLIFFFPIVFGTFFQQLYNTIDTIIVGHFIGKSALASVGGSSTQIVNLVVGFFTGLSSGASVIIAQFYGARDERSVQESLHTAYAFSILGSIAISIPGILLAPHLFFEVIQLVAVNCLRDPDIRIVLRDLVLKTLCALLGGL